MSIGRTRSLNSARMAATNSPSSSARSRFFSRRSFKTPASISVIVCTDKNRLAPLRSILTARHPPVPRHSSPCVGVQTLAASRRLGHSCRAFRRLGSRAHQLCHARRRCPLQPCTDPSRCLASAYDRDEVGGTVSSYSSLSEEEARAYLPEDAITRRRAYEAKRKFREAVHSI
jgi:hypothetical protein